MCEKTSSRCVRVRKTPNVWDSRPMCESWELWITIDQELKKALARPMNRNQLNKDTKTLKSLRDPQITIEPADKNLGTVILNSSDYVDSLIHLASETYIRVASFPEHSIKHPL